MAYISDAAISNLSNEDIKKALFLIFCIIAIIFMVTTRKRVSKSQNQSSNSGSNSWQSPISPALTLVFTGLFCWLYLYLKMNVYPFLTYKMVWSLGLISGLLVALAAKKIKNLINKKPPLV